MMELRKRIGLVSKQSGKGFTLIEILVVISLIGLLSSIMIAGFSAARATARDVQRQESVHQILNALTASLSGSAFPSTGGAAYCLGTTGSCWGGAANGNAAFNTLISPALKTAPVDPSRTTGLGDRFLYQDATTFVAYHCGPTYPTGPFILWEPDTLGPTTDAACSPGYYACCSGSLGCALPGGTNGRFCAYQIQ